MLASISTEETIRGVAVVRDVASVRAALNAGARHVIVSYEGEGSDEDCEAAFAAGGKSDVSRRCSSTSTISA